jgi:hypothetical protein
MLTIYSPALAARRVRNETSVPGRIGDVFEEEGVALVLASDTAIVATMREW